MIFCWMILNLKFHSQSQISLTIMNSNMLDDQDTTSVQTQPADITFGQEDLGTVQSTDSELSEVWSDHQLQSIGKKFNRTNFKSIHDPTIRNVPARKKPTSIEAAQTQLDEYEGQSLHQGPRRFQKAEAGRDTEVQIQ